MLRWQWDYEVSVYACHVKISSLPGINEAVALDDFCGSVDLAPECKGFGVPCLGGKGALYAKPTPKLFSLNVSNQDKR